MNATLANGVHAIGDVEFRQAFVDCGSATCRACASSPSHGPYWFATWVEGGEPQQCRIGKYLSVGELRRRLSDDGRLHHKAVADLFRRVDTFEQRGEAEAAKRKADEEARRASEWRAHREADEAFARARAARERDSARAAEGPRVTWQHGASSSGAAGRAGGDAPPNRSETRGNGASGRAPGPSSGDSSGAWRTKGAGSDRKAGPSHGGRAARGPSSQAGSRGGARPGAARSGAPSPWAVLGVPATASTAEIKRAYRKLAMRFHPDLGGDVEAMKRLNDAYRSLEELGAVSG